MHVSARIDSRGGEFESTERKQDPFLEARVLKKPYHPSCSFVSMSLDVRTVLRGTGEMPQF